jgi:DNA-binding CsgD family transcriptional regulator
VNHVLLFVYILLMSAGTGGAVALGLLHYRLRTPITRAFLVANIGLFISLLLVLVSMYLESVPRDATAVPFQYSQLRTILGLVLGVVVYGSVAWALVHLDGVHRGLVLGTAVVAIAAMGMQTTLFMIGEIGLALRTAPAYMYTISACLLVFGIVLIRHGGTAQTPTMAWFLVRLGYLNAVFAVASAVVYTLLERIPGLQQIDLSLDFLYYIVWSVLSIAAFVRYITRPAALIQDDEIHAAFISSYGITPREVEVIRLISQGLSNQEIADRLHLSFATVRTHVYNVFKKTGAGSRVDLLRLVSGFRE